MKYLILFFVYLVAFEHIYFMILEMFFWTKPKGLKAFGMKLEQAESSKVLAANQGLYNGFFHHFFSDMRCNSRNIRGLLY